MTNYKIEDNWLRNESTPVQEITNSKNKYSSGNNICDYIVFHYTASTTAKSAHNTYKSPDTSVSWHLTIDRDGSIYQLLDFRKRAWHAGRSNWMRPNGTSTRGLNKWAIGIELINAGPLKLESGVYKTWFGKVVSAEDIFIDSSGKAWHDYTDAQKDACEEIIPVLIDKYKCIDILGHEDIAPTRKTDPGRAFDDTLTSLRERYIR